MAEAGGGFDLDALVLGGGVAGLWILRELQARGRSAWLAETGALGRGQTAWSQGIVHGGMKYALDGTAGEAARAIAAMPERWRGFLSGRGSFRLDGVRVLSPHQYLWSDGGWLSGLATSAAAHVLAAAPRPVPDGELPEGLAPAAARGRVLRLEEPVLDTASLLAALAAGARGAALACERVEFEGADPARRVVLVHGGTRVAVRPRVLVLAAGAGNEGLCARLGVEGAPMQRRPLHQVLVRGRLPRIHGHCLEAGMLPRLTVTAAEASGGEVAWNVGGKLAERGVGLDLAAQVAAARVELAAALPWVDLGGARISASVVDRAEPRREGGGRPDLPWVGGRPDVLVCWPTKLAFAPRLADEVAARVVAAGPEPVGGRGAPPGLPPAAVQVPPWEEGDRTWL